jgi:3-methyladenine DNA glycosylase/8-oxoguanine DNA glycosylase
VRAGYRASRAVELAGAFAEGRIDDRHFDDPSLSTEEVRERLLALPGFGPYAAGQALRLFGRYDDLALDSWCRSKLAQLEGKKKPRSDRAIEKSYARYGTYRGLVLWMHLTADWHTKPKGVGLPP